MIRAISELEVRSDFLGLIAEVEAGSWFEIDRPDHLHWLDRRITRRIGSGGQFYGAYLPDGQPLAIYCLLIEDHPSIAGHAEVLDLGVVKTHRRRGHATRLLRDAQLKSRAAGVSFLFIETYAGDDITITVYEKAGFVRIAEIPGLNGPTDRGQLILQKKLD
jgi:ribosomal protein S18 acetylase RimI-like enzyme